MKYFVYILKGAKPGEEEPWNRRLCFRAESYKPEKGKITFSVEPEQLNTNLLSINSALVVEIENKSGDSEYRYILLEAFRVLDPIGGLKKGEKHIVVLYGDLVRI